jgi:hypothetical protein
VAGVEELIRRYALLATGQPQEQLDEHRDNVLPDLEATAAVVRDHFGEVSVRGNGNLQDWLLMMLLKHQLMGRPALQPLLDGSDILYNLSLAARDDVAPFYRHLVAGRRQGEVAFGQPPERGGSLDAATVLGALVDANLSEVVRQDAVPRLDDLLARAAVQQDQLRQTADAHALLASRLESVEAALADVQALLHRLVKPLQALRHPLRRSGPPSDADG